MIDWEEQWAYHSFDFREGYAHIPLPEGREIRLKPGPGFGDFSHATTRLSLDLLGNFCQGKTVFDIGTGSGILAIGAALMGAKEVFAIDIDSAALIHARENAKINDVSISFSSPMGKVDVIVMNMIASEQKNAWQMQGSSFQILLTSGILVSQLAQYLAFAEKQEWLHQKTLTEGAWAACIFKGSK